MDLGSCRKVIKDGETEFVVANMSEAVQALERASGFVNSEWIHRSEMPTNRQGGELRPSYASPGPGGCEKMRFLWQQLVLSVLGISEARSQGLPSQTATMS